MVEGLYRGWDELRSVPSGQQSGLRVIVLFTDGASNSVPGNYPAAPGLSKGSAPTTSRRCCRIRTARRRTIRTIEGLYDTQTGVAQSPLWSLTVSNWNNTGHALAGAGAAAHELPLAPSQRGIPTAFPLQTNALKVNGAAQSSVRGPAAHQRQRPVSGGSLQHQQRGAATCSRSSPTRRATTTATTRSASTRSAWASWCATSSARCPRRRSRS